MRTGPTKQEKTTEIYFDEKDPTIFIRTHNTDLKNRLTAYSRKHPAVCKLTDVDPDTGCKEFEIEKGCATLGTVNVAANSLSGTADPIQRGTPQGGKRSGEKRIKGF